MSKIKRGKYEMFLRRMQRRLKNKGIRACVDLNITYRILNIH